MTERGDPTNWRALLAVVLPWLTMAVFIELLTVGAFSGGMWGGIGIGLSLILFFATAWLDDAWPRPSREVVRLALISLAVIAVLNLVSTDPHQSWFDWKRLVTIFLPLLLLSAPQLTPRASQRWFFPLLTLAAFGGAFSLGIELLLDAPVLHMAKGDHASLTGYNRGMSYLVMLAWPIMAALWTRSIGPALPHRRESDNPHQIAMPFPHRALPPKMKWRVTRPMLWRAAERLIPFLLFILVMLFPTGLTESRASKLAFLAGLLTSVVASIAPRFTQRGLAGLVIVLLGWPLAAQKLFVMFQNRLDHLPDSWRARVEIWDYMSYRIAEHPWLGWGLGTSKSLDFKNPHGDLYKLTLEAAPHPHNVVTQLWVELGVPGLVLGVAFAFLTLRQAGRLTPRLVPFAYGAWVAGLCLTLVAYNFWTDSLFASFALTGFAFALLEHKLFNQSPKV